MIPLNKKMIFLILLLYVVNISLYGMQWGLFATILFTGIIYYVGNMISIYARLKNTHFSFKKAATKKEWIYFLLTILVVWITFFTILPAELTIYANVMSNFISVFLISIDLIRTWWKKF